MSRGRPRGRAAVLNQESRAMSHPYRTAVQPTPAPMRALGTWRRYVLAGRVYTALRWFYYVALVAGLLFADGETTPFFVGFPMVLGVAFWFVAYAKCPFCLGEIARGPKQRSYLEVLFGKYPTQCTHCDAPVGATEYVAPAPEVVSAPKPEARRAPRRDANALVDDLFYEMGLERRRARRRPQRSNDARRNAC